jgi:uncharacterized DUF497 family protein
MKITFDPVKRAETLQRRFLDFADASLFAGLTMDVADSRQDDGEPRVQTIGYLAGRMVMVVWTPRGDARRIMSMRYCNDRERKIYGPHLQIPQ